MNTIALAVTSSLAGATVLLAAGVAAADPTLDAPAEAAFPSAPVANEAPVTGALAPGSRSNPPERGLLFAVEPTVPDPGHAVVAWGMGNVSRTGEERPIGAGQAFPTLGGEVGILSRLSVYAEGGVVVVQSASTFYNDQGNVSPFILDTGLHILLTDPDSRMWRLSLRPSYSYDVDGSSTANLTATLGWYYKQVRVVASFMGSHTFEDGSDPVDLQATLGATYALPYGFRVGLEGVAADVEELVQAGAEGGTTAFAGPTAGWEWGRIQLVAGPSVGVTPGAFQNDSFLFRAAASLRL
jgi:hypothetical protein